MIVSILISFYLGLNLRGNIIPDDYFIEFKKKSFIYGLGGDFRSSEEDYKEYLREYKEYHLEKEFSFNLKFGFEKGSILKTLNGQFVFLLIPGYSYTFYWVKYPNQDDHLKHYIHHFYAVFVSGVSVPFLIKNLDLKIRISSSFLKFHYYNELFLKITDKKPIEERREERYFLDSQLLKGPIVILLLIKI
ncbi:MAG: hypothetical protein ABIN20_02610 [candidate division WOR-3 bacterium]